MTKKLVIIGNADIDVDHSDFINSCDLVIRFNLCRNYNINTGKKIDVLCLTNTGPHAISFYHERKISKLGFVRNIGEVWFVRPRKRFIDKLFFNRKTETEYGKNIVISNNLTGKDIEYITNDLYKTLWDKLLSLGSTNAVMPSSGMVVIEKVVSDGKYHDYEKYLVGFSHEGWEGHPWDLEKKLIDHYVSNGSLFKPAF